MQFDSEIRIPLGLEYNKFSVYQEPVFSVGLPENTTIVPYLLQPYTKSSSSNETFSNEGFKVFMTTPSDATYQQVIGTGDIASCFTCELQVIIEALDLCETPYSRTG
ncbi:hypothetical protein TNCV_2930671 [Trichonephila clavipes]|nr:hypothetical protein TNCV_2930671 [Trichonephila clavipes]